MVTKTPDEDVRRFIIRNGYLIMCCRVRAAHATEAYNFEWLFQILRSVLTRYQSIEAFGYAGLVGVTVSFRPRCEHSIGVGIYT